MDADLREALEALSDFREFWSRMVIKTHEGANYHNPMWARIVAILDKHGMNDQPGFFDHNPAYSSRS